MKDKIKNIEKNSPKKNLNKVLSFCKKISPLSVVMGRELKSVFYSSFFYVVSGLFVLVVGILFFFMNGFLAKNISSLDELFFALTTASYIVIPLLIFNSWEKEKTSGTLELLFSFPISEFSIVLAKILVVFIQYFALMILSFIFPIVISPYADFSISIIFCQYFIHLSYSLFAICLSSFFFVVFKSSILAICFSFLCLFCLGYINYIPVLVSVPSFLEKIISFLSIKFRIIGANRGVLDSRDIMFFICNAVLFFFFQERFFFLRRWSK